MNHRKYILAIALMIMTDVSAMAAGQITFSGNSKAVYTETPAKTTGLDAIYVLFSTSGVTMSYTATSSENTVTWYTYGSQGGGYAETISGVAKDGNVTSLSNIIANSGYIIEEGTERTYVWVVNYADYTLHLNSIAPASAQDCGTTALNVDGSGADITYYTITGVPKKLDREITLTYNTLTWSSDDSQWKSTAVTKSYDVFKSAISIEAPLCNTTFTLEGDKLLKYWGLGQSITSDSYTTNAVSVETTATQEAKTDNDNEIKGDESGLGGSAPATITFKAYCTDAIVNKQWQMATDADFKNITLQQNDEEMVQTFNEAGTFYVRFVGSNESGTCETEGETYTISIGESSLKCPNAFSPQSSEGVNDEWKVSYKSIIEFKCWIFNQWGTKICTLTDPSQGWDGKYKGKYVGSGVYYYVIEAKGSDGKNYKLKGDINIINFKSSSGTSTTDTTTGE
ncbi:MAG: gliding motility-associated C-terminal domain-containing protein [Muribaculaceae bacterium]|jgi:gliding motility-associated-like protein|nr:gliding motility-associated C-terminal domain-containing protein [Muribaculaceae bacterium]